MIRLNLFRCAFILALGVPVVAGCGSEAGASYDRAALDADARAGSTSWNFRVFGYHAWWMRDLWKSYDLSLLDKVIFFELRAASDGSIEEGYGWPHDAAALSEEARRRGVAIVPTVAILEAPVFRSIFSSRENTDRLLASVMGAVRDAQADGVHLNFELFEPVEPELGARLTDFARRVRAGLDAYRPGAELTIFTPGFDHSGAYDESALASAADYLVVQGYDMHWSDGPQAGPLAPLSGWNGANWETIIHRYRSAGVPAEKLVMTVPFYGYEWPTVSEHPGAETRGAAETITYAHVDPTYLPLIRISALDRVQAHGLQRDPVSRTPYYAYRTDEGWYQGWFEDEASLREKYRFVEERGLAGIAIFLLGYDGGKLMTSLY